MGDSTYREVAFIYNIDKTLAFGKEVIIKDIQYGITESPYSDTTWWDFRSIAEGFGMIWAQLEPMAPVYLTGAIINGVRYGYIVSVEKFENKPKEFILQQNYPNPFNPSTEISFTISKYSYVSLRIFDVLGKHIASLITEELPAGKYSKSWNATNLSSGIFLPITSGVIYRNKKNDFAEIVYLECAVASVVDRGLKENADGNYTY